MGEWEDKLKEEKNRSRYKGGNKDQSYFVWLL